MRLTGSALVIGSSSILHLIHIGAVALGLHLVAGNEPQVRGVDAVPKPATIHRPVGEHVAEVAFPKGRADLGPDHPMRRVAQLVDTGDLNRLG